MSKLQTLVGRGVCTSLRGQGVKIYICLLIPTGPSTPLGDCTFYLNVCFV